MIPIKDNYKIGQKTIKDNYKIGQKQIIKKQ